MTNWKILLLVSLFTGDLAIPDMAVHGATMDTAVLGDMIVRGVMEDMAVHGFIESKEAISF